MNDPPIPMGVGASTLPAVPSPEKERSPEKELSPEALILRAIEAQVPVEGLERLLAMRAGLRREAAEAAFLEALAGFQGDCPVIPKRKTAGAGSYSYKYAPLEDIVQAVAPLLVKWGLSYTFEAAFEAEPHPAQVVTCRVHHVQGHSKSSSFRSPMDMGSKMNVMQRSASSLTYGKRYAFCDALGILTGDEEMDGRTVDSDGEIHRGRGRGTDTQTTPPVEASKAAQGSRVPADSGRAAVPPPTAPRPAGVGPQPRRQNVVTVPPQSKRELAEDAAQAHLSGPEKDSAGVGPEEEQPPHPAGTMEQARRGELGPDAQATAANLDRLPEGVEPNVELLERQRATQELLQLRQQAREMAGMLWQLRVEERNRKSKAENQRRALNSQPLLALTPDPGSEPTDESDQKLHTWIESAFPGRKLETLDETSLQKVLASLSKMCEDLTEKLKSTGPPPEPERS